jgi:hypothetical protein
MSRYEIYALKYAGPFTRTGAHLMWYRDWDKVEQINYYIWCIRGRAKPWSWIRVSRHKWQ